MLEDSGLDPTDRFVATVIAYFTDPRDENAYPSLATLSKLTGYDRRTVARSVTRLRERGAIVQTGTRGTGTLVYRIPVRDGRGTAPPEAERLGAQRPQRQRVPFLGAERPPILQGTLEEKESSNEDPKETERELYEYWLTATNRNGRTSLTPNRLKALRARLKDSTPDEIRQAIDGCAGSDWHMGRHPKTKGKDFSDLKDICRNREQIEKFIRMAVTAKPRHLTEHREQANAYVERQKRKDAEWQAQHS